MLDAREQLTVSDAIASQLVGHNHPRHVLQTLQQPVEEAFRGVAIAPGLNEYVEYNAILIDGAPKIVRNRPVSTAWKRFRADAYSSQAASR